jgi:hypothetical protein
MCDTDSMAIVATENGGLIPCPGGKYRSTDGREAIKALSWPNVEQICKKFQGLNPYKPEIVKELLKIEDCNYERAFDQEGNEIKGKQQQLYGLAISSKRYCLSTDREIIKPSEHALGAYYFPDERERYKPNHFKAKKYPMWIVEAWQPILGLSETDPTWFKYLSMRKWLSPRLTFSAIFALLTTTQRVRTTSRSVLFCPSQTPEDTSQFRAEKAVLGHNCAASVHHRDLSGTAACEA